MLVLGIETSCDETAVAVVRDGVEVLSNVITSMSSRYAELAGVIPEDAARNQLACMMPVLGAAMTSAGVQPSDLDVIAITRGPGLLGSLLVGTATARQLSVAWNVPLVGIHHTLGHLSSVWPDAQVPPQFPSLTLSVSGGHSDLWLRESHLKGKLIGRTRDDAVGEAFDKGASLLGLPYPGGPAIAKAAEKGDPFRYAFPAPLKDDDTLDFSFSGLKTALRYLLRDLNIQTVTQEQLPDIAASYQHALCAHLVDRVNRVLNAHPVTKEVHLVGGVSASLYLRALLQKSLAENHPGVIVRWPAQFPYCTDNAVMIASAAYFLLQERPEALVQPFATDAMASLHDVFSAV